MEVNSYECRGCGYILFTEKKEAPRKCPLCREKMLESGEEKLKESTGFRCLRCGYTFIPKSGQLEPYKCPNCNFTFATTPKRKVIYRL